MNCTNCNIEMKKLNFDEYNIKKCRKCQTTIVSIKMDSKLTPSKKLDRALKFSKFFKLYKE